MQKMNKQDKHLEIIFRNQRKKIKISRPKVIFLIPELNIKFPITKFEKELNLY